MDSPIVPSIGRVVLYVAEGGEVACGLITNVHSNNCINIMVMCDRDKPRPAVSVMYNENKIMGTWHWMEYQKQQAIKTTVAELTSTNSQ